jgi:hypothetical protein
MSKNGGLAGLACGFLFACVEACSPVGSGSLVPSVDVPCLNGPYSGTTDSSRADGSPKARHPQGIHALGLAQACL